MGKIDDIAKLQPTQLDELPEPLADIDEHDGAEATVIIPTAEGWRHGSGDVDLLEAEIVQRSRKLAEDSVDRVLAGKLSPAEQAFLSPDGP